MKHAYIFPGQGSQFPGMGKEHYTHSAFAKKMFEQANEILGFRISDIMFEGSEEELKQTNVTQPAVFIHSVIAYKSIDGVRPDMVAGHSLGEISALVANGVLRFEDGLNLVAVRAAAMQKACELKPSAMSAILALEDEKIESILAEITKESGEVVVPANYNSPGQLVISGSVRGVELANERLKAAGARRALMLQVSGAFHSPFMEPAKEELKTVIEQTTFYTPNAAIYQNVVAKAVVSKDDIKKNLIDQLTGAVKWSQSVTAMISDGATRFTEVGPGRVMQGLVHKINKDVQVDKVD